MNIPYHQTLNKAALLKVGCAIRSRSPSNFRPKSPNCIGLTHNWREKLLHRAGVEYHEIQLAWQYRQITRTALRYYRLVKLQTARLETK
jgi:hypothetical protein